MGRGFGAHVGLLGLLCLNGVRSDGPVVITPLGPIKGVDYGSFVAFKGIFVEFYSLAARRSWGVATGELHAMRLISLQVFPTPRSLSGSLLPRRNAHGMRATRLMRRASATVAWHQRAAIMTLIPLKATA